MTPCIHTITATCMPWSCRVVSGVIEICAVHSGTGQNSSGRESIIPALMVPGDADSQCQQERTIAWHAWLSFPMQPTIRIQTGCPWLSTNPSFDRSSMSAPPWTTASKRVRTCTLSVICFRKALNRNSRQDSRRVRPSSLISQTPRGESDFRSPSRTILSRAQFAAFSQRGLPSLVSVS